MMRSPRRLRALLPLSLVTLCAALGAFAAGTTARARDAPRRAAPAPRPLHALAPPTAGWKEVDRLAGEQKMQAALDLASKLRQQAQQHHDDSEWARGLIREVQLRMALHGYE